jgi:hypothetical protein
MGNDILLGMQSFSSFVSGLHAFRVCGGALLRLLGGLVAIWIVAALVVGYVRGNRPTTESVAAMMTRDLPSASEPEARRKEIDRIAASLNRLDFDARQQLRKTRTDVGFFKNLDADERVAFLEKTLPEGFRQTIEALNKMNPAERKRLLDRALARLHKETPDRDWADAGAEVQKALAVGMETFLRDANAQVKVEFAPVLEELQRGIRSQR